ncbi:translation initiation factor IF-3 [Patescibacteria group bacterium]
MFKKTLINNQIRASQVRIIDETGKQLGIMLLEEALQTARGRNLDLIQVTEKAEPPVCKIMDYGKFLYQQKKKDKSIKKSQTELKGIRLGFGISPHDLEIRARQAEKFLKKGDKVRIEMKLRGREKALQGFAREKINKFLEILEGFIPYKIEKGVKKEPRGLTMIISKK